MGRISIQYVCYLAPFDKLRANGQDLRFLKYIILQYSDTAGLLMTVLENLNE
ncbi:hypothetical protein GALL_146490 [mine drainage metagenome]|uniref:Uncharacterized protein n=1 Tax=mine drainage metagenome TaxID=410659 RepID=A0A1J5S4X5_9ZZZZ